MLSSIVASISADQPASDKSTVVTECSPARKVSQCVIPSPIKTGLTTQKSRSVLPLSGLHPGASISGLNCVLFSTTGAGVIRSASLISGNAGLSTNKDCLLESTPTSGAAAVRSRRIVNVELFHAGLATLSTKRISDVLLSEFDNIARKPYRKVFIV